MAKDKKGFILYADLLKVCEKLILKDRENKTNYTGELFYAILLYVNDLEELIDIDFIVELAFEPIKQQLKRDLKKWESRAEQSRKNGLKGGRPKTQQNQTKPTGFFNNLTEPKKPVNVNVNDNVNVKDNEIVSSIDDVLFNVDDLVLRILDDKKLISNFCAYNKTDEKTFKSKLNEFTLFLKSKGVHTKQHKEFVDYFGNWFRKKQTITKTDETHKKIIL